MLWQEIINISFTVSELFKFKILFANEVICLKSDNFGCLANGRLKFLRQILPTTLQICAKNQQNPPKNLQATACIIRLH